MLFQRTGVNQDKKSATAAMVNYGVEGVEAVATRLGACIESTGGNLPLPELGGEMIRRVAGWVDLDALMAKVRAGGK